MMGSVRIRYYGPVPGSLNLGQREWNNLKKAVWYQVGLYWFQQFRPKHFTSAGATEYGYAPRAGERGRPGDKGFNRSYTGRKLRKMGHTRPLEYSGKSKQDAAHGRVVSTFKGVRIGMNAPTLNLRPKGGTIDMAREMRAISVREIKELIRLHNRMMDARIRAIRTATTITL